MTVKQRETQPLNRIFQTEETSSDSVAELFEAAAKWVRAAPGISVIDISLHQHQMDPDKLSLELDIYFE